MRIGTFVAGAALAVALAGCKRGGDAAGNNGAFAAPSLPALNVPEPSPAPAAPAASGNVAIGRWVESAGTCADLSDVAFTETSIILHESDGQPRETLPARYSNATATSVTIDAGDPSRPVVATLTDATHLVITSPGRPERTCTLVRR